MQTYRSREEFAALPAAVLAAMTETDIEAAVRLFAAEDGIEPVPNPGQQPPKFEVAKGPRAILELVFSGGTTIQIAASRDMPVEALAREADQIAISLRAVGAVACEMEWTAFYNGITARDDRQFESASASMRMLPFPESLARTSSERNRMAQARDEWIKSTDAHRAWLREIGKVEDEVRGLIAKARTAEERKQRIVAEYFVLLGIVKDHDAALTLVLRQFGEAPWLADELQRLSRAERDRELPAMLPAGDSAS